MHIYKDFIVYNALFGTLITLIRNIDKEKYQIMLCVLNYKENHWGKEFEKYGGKIINLNIDSHNPFKIIRRIVNCIENEKPDIVQTHEMKMNILGRLAAIKAKSPIIIGTIWTLRDTAFSTIRRVRDRLLSPLHKYLDSRSRVVIAISNAIKRDWDPLNRKSLYKVIYIPYDPERINKSSDIANFHRLMDFEKNKNIFIIGVISRLSEEKGIQYLLRSIPKILKQEKNIAVYIAGEGKYKPKLEALINKLKISNYVRMIGHINNINAFLEKIDLFVQPSRSESLGIAIMEAMAKGVAVIATRVGGIPEIIENGKTGLLVNKKDPEDLAEKIIYLIKNADLRNKLGNEGQAVIAKRFGVREFVKETTDLYEKLLNES